MLRLKLLMRLLLLDCCSEFRPDPSSAGNVPGHSTVALLSSLSFQFSCPRLVLCSSPPSLSAFLLPLSPGLRQPLLFTLSLLPPSIPFSHLNHPNDSVKNGAVGNTTLVAVVVVVAVTVTVRLTWEVVRTVDVDVTVAVAMAVEVTVWLI